MKRNILVIGPYIPGKSYGGPVKSILNMVESLSDDFRFYIVTRDRDLGASTPYTSVNIGKWNTVGKAQVFYLPKGKELKYLLKILTKMDFDIIYNSSFFAKNSLFIQLLKRLNIIQRPVIVAPRGEFVPGALEIKSVKKRAFLKIYKTMKIQECLSFNCTSTYDRRDIESILGEKARIYVAGNIINSVINISKKDEEKFVGQLKIVTLSRIARKKNLDFSLRLLKMLAEREKNYQISFDIYGPIEDENYWNKCLSIIKDIGDQVHIQYRGPVEYEDVIKRLSHYHVFLLPTQGENFGHVIQEALLAGCPVIISDQTPWKELKKLNAGFDIALSNEQGYIDAIDYYLHMDDAEYLTSSIHAYEYGIKKVHSQTAIIENRNMFNSEIEKYERSI